MINVEKICRFKHVENVRRRGVAKKQKTEKQKTIDHINICSVKKIAIENIIFDYKQDLFCKKLTLIVLANNLADLENFTKLNDLCCY